MKFKLDENFGPRVQEVFARRGHDCRSVLEEGLGGATDDKVLEAANVERRVLVTMDHDFGNVLVYPPERTSGIAVVRPDGRASMDLLRSMVGSLIDTLQRRAIRGRLWIVEASRIREHDTDEAHTEDEDEKA